jgi:hypothetical protein
VRRSTPSAPIDGTRAASDSAGLTNGYASGCTQSERRCESTLPSNDSDSDSSNKDDNDNKDDNKDDDDDDEVDDNNNDNNNDNDDTTTARDDDSAQYAPSTQDTASATARSRLTACPSS